MKIMEPHSNSLMRFCFTSINSRCVAQFTVGRYTHEEPELLIFDLKNLHDAGLLMGKENQKYFKAVVAHKNPKILISAFETLHKLGLLEGEQNQIYFETVLALRGPNDISNALMKLYESNLLIGEENRKYFEAIVMYRYREPIELAYAFNILHESNLLIGEENRKYFEAVVAHQEPRMLASALKTLQASGLLTNDVDNRHFEQLKNFQYSYYKFQLLINLLRDAHLLEGEGRNILGQATFEQLMRYQVILFEKQGFLFEQNIPWDRVTSDMLTPESWTHILQLCRANLVNPEAGRVHLGRYIRRTLLGLNPRAQAFNPTQSTHTASVHESVSKAALLLKGRYADEIIKLEEQLQAIKTWVDIQPEHTIEKRAIKALIEAPYEFVDPVSQVTTKQLLALSWVAIHDDSQRLGELADAQMLFLQGLYDIQRAYNLDEHFDDRGGEDKKACASGTFNKIIEKLIGVYPGVEILSITSQGAQRKIWPLVREAVNTYLQSHDNVENLKISRLKENIKPLIREQLYFEFGNKQIRALTEQYPTFETLQASSNYSEFQRLLQEDRSIDVDLELLIDGKLLTENKELDDQIKALIDKHTSMATLSKTSTTAVETKPSESLSKEALREARLKYFESGEPGKGSGPKF